MSVSSYSGETLLSLFTFSHIRGLYRYTPAELKMFCEHRASALRGVWQGWMHASFIHVSLAAGAYRLSNEAGFVESRLR